MDRPATYNTHDEAGAGNILRYNFVNEETYAVWGYEDNAVTVDPVSLDWTITEVTTAKTDLAATFSSWAYDAKSGGTRSTPPVAVTIKRYQKPIVVISDITRTTTTATMDIIVSDTGYGVTQVNTQILKVEYNLASAGWLDASLIGWSGLENSFQLTGLTEGARYALQIRVTNNKPVPALSDKVSSVYSVTILEYTPAFFVFSDAGDSVSGTAHKALLVHSDFSTAVGAGSEVIENDLAVGGTITEGGNAVWHAGNLNKPTRTLLWSGSQVPTADTMSYSDTDTYDFFTIHLTSNVNAAHHTDIMTRAGGYTYLTVNEYHVSKDSVWRSYGSYMICTAYTGAWLVKNIWGFKMNNTL